MNTMNNAVLALSGIIFSFNIVANVFIQIDFGSILNELAAIAKSGVRPTELGLDVDNDG